ncbi:hypothetical protein [Clostridium botulinum]|uniref:hypothetical protein n=1 Tax=Clostridium botulinum TaxID=1491 RepID=UPI00249F565E|nr:hypothetical protein [Clostridium botulinum]WGZ48076.1 hypothetical protein HEQ52_18180 [Clostridium botulinum]
MVRLIEETIGARIEFNNNNYIASIQQVISQTNDFRNAVQRTRETMEHAARTRVESRIRVDNTQAMRSTREVRDNLRRLQQNRPITIAARDMTRQKFRNVMSSLSRIVGSPHRVVLNAVDKTKKVMSSIKNSIFNLKTLAAGIVFGATAKAGFDATIGAGSRLEQEEVSMKHFIGYQNKGKKGFNVEKATQDYIAQLRHNANVTPFGTNEVISAGRRAVNIMQGDTKGGMELVKLAENMAALNPGKTVMDAMEALADLKQGEAERMKEFGFKFSADDFVEASGASKKKDKKGKEKKMKMSDLTDEQFNTAYGNIVKSKLNPFFAGGAEKLSKTAAGQWSTTTGMVGSMGADVGKAFLPPINKVLQQVNKRFESFSGSKAFGTIKKNVESFANSQGKKILSLFDDLEKHPEKIGKGFNNVKNVLKGIGDVLKTVGKLAKEAYKMVKPLLNFAGKNPKAALGILAGLKLGPGLFKNILKAPKNIKQLKKDLLELKTALGFLKGASKNNLKGIGSVFKSIGKFTGKGIGKGLKGTLNVFKSIGKFTGKGITKGLKGTLTVLKTIGKGFGVVFKGIGKGAGVAFKTTLKIIKVAGKGIGKGLMSMLKIFKTVGAGMIKTAGRVFAFLAANPIVAIILVIIGICVLLYQAWKHNWGGIRDKTRAVIDFCKEKISSIKETFEAVKKKCGEFAEAIKKKWGELKEFFKHPIKGTIELAKKGAAWVQEKVSGSHATGLQRVPYNGYVAELHEGEEVLTAQKARTLRDGSSGIAIAKLADTIIVREESDIDKITDALVRKLKKTSFNMA